MNTSSPLGRGCNTCNSQNLPSVASFGYSQAQIDTMWSQDYSSFAEDEAAVMETPSARAELRKPRRLIVPLSSARCRRENSWAFSRSRELAPAAVEKGFLDSWVMKKFLQHIICYLWI